MIPVRNFCNVIALKRYIRFADKIRASPNTDFFARPLMSLLTSVAAMPVFKGEMDQDRGSPSRSRAKGRGPAGDFLSGAGMPAIPRVGNLLQGCAKSDLRAFWLDLMGGRIGTGGCGFDALEN